MKLSFVIPCYRSENTIGIVVQEIRDTIVTRPGTDYEIILVNDCSPDNVWQAIKQLAAEDCHIKGICLAKNFGQHSALMAGYGQTTGDFVISLDDDGQTPANECFKLVDKLEEGFDVVYACHVKSTQRVYRRFGSFVNRKMAESLIGQPQNLRASSFFIARKFVIDQITQYQNSFPYIGGLIFRTTKKIGSVEIQHRKRILGESNYTLMSLLSLWINGFTAFSVKPLLGSGIYIIIQKIMTPEMLMGYASIMSTMLFLGGMIMLILGLIGEYIGRIYICINQSPQYVIREKV